MGGSGGTSAQHRAYGEGASGKFPSGKRMGTVYRCNHSGSQCTGSPDRLYALGQTGTKQDPDAHKPEASDPEGSASESAFCVPRILWVQAFQPGERVSWEEWNCADRLADWGCINILDKITKKGLFFEVEIDIYYRIGSRIDHFISKEWYYERHFFLRFIINQYIVFEPWIIIGIQFPRN